RLVAAARAGQILCSAMVSMVAGSRAPAELTDLGTMELKGLPRPLAVCEVAWAPASAAGTQVPLPSLLTDRGRVFVGRDGELDRLLDLWKEAVAGERKVALLGGEPGIGKTRLAAELAEALHSQGAMILAGRCDEDLGVPYQPFVVGLRHYLAHAAEPRLGRHGGELARLIPDLGLVVPGLPEPLRSDPETERYRLFDAISSWLADVAAETPVLLILDDLQWAAKPTLLLLRHVVRAAEPARLLVVATYRDTDIGRDHPLTELLADFRRDGQAARLPLTGLDAPGVAAFMEAAAGHGLDEEAEGLARAVWTETEGNPFFVTEVFRHLSESGAVKVREGRWAITGALDEVGIPEGVRDVVGRRLSRLSEVTNRVLTVAAVAGLEFEPALVAPAGGFAEDEVIAAVEEAVGARLVVEVPAPFPHTRFSHALVRATLYDELTAGRRVALHRKVAEAIETLHARRLDDHLPALAHHWARASAPAAEAGKAVDYATRAGHRALAQLAHDEAATYYAQALELLDAAGTAADDPRRVDLLIALGSAQRRAGRGEHRETLMEAARQAEQRGDADALARAALANSRNFIFSAAGTIDAEQVELLHAALAAIPATDSPIRARLLATLAAELFWAGDHAERQRLSDEALGIARRLGDASTSADVLAARIIAVWAPHTVEE
ncbi:MAG: ATP-binding protein, partial [Acidimicrobiia bacterium]